MQMSYFLMIFGLLYISGCSTGSRTTVNDLSTPKGYESPTITALTSVGESFSAKLSSSNQRLIFISAARAKHAQPQAYEMDLVSKQDRRLTFQDGEIFDLIYSPGDKGFFYSSTTDEIKENPKFIRDLKNQMATGAPQNLPPSASTDLNGRELPSTEIYLSSMAGDDIQRLTHRENFDGYLANGSSRNEVIFISFVNGAPHFNFLNLLTKGNRVFKIDADIVQGLQASRDGQKLIWTQKLKEEFQIMVSDAKGQNPKSLLSSKSIYLNPSFTNDASEIVFSSNMDQNFELYVIKADGSCLRRLTYHTANDTEPILSADQKQLIFTSNRSGQRQLYAMNYNPPPCPESIRP